MKLLDCTLRDGGYYTNWDFDRNLVDSYVKTIATLGIEYLELGYRSRELKGYYGEYFYTPVSRLEQLRDLAPMQKFVLMVNAKDSQPKDLEAILPPVKKYIDMIRIATPPSEVGSALLLTKVIKELGFKAAINVMYISKLADDPGFYPSIAKLKDELDYLYLVDSYGGVYPDELRKIIGEVKARTNVPLGFHGHNNIDLAFANAIVALQEGVEIIDATILGMGRGAGNLKTEMILPYIKKLGGSSVNYSAISQLVTTFQDLQTLHGWGNSFPYIVSGLNSLPQADVMKMMSMKRYSVSSIVDALLGDKAAPKQQTFGTFDDKTLMNRRAILIGGGATVPGHINSIRKIIEKDRELVVVYLSTKHLPLFHGLANAQVMCLTGEEGTRSAGLPSTLLKSLKHFVLPPSPRRLDCTVPVGISERTSELGDSMFSQELRDAPLATGLQVALDIRAQLTIIVGVDGYHGADGHDFKLHVETQAVLDQFSESSLDYFFGTPTEYKVKFQRSIHAHV